jgi:hypothetical protein
MGLLSKLLSRTSKRPAQQPTQQTQEPAAKPRTVVPPSRTSTVAATSPWDERPKWMHGAMRATLIEGNEDLEVVGESHYQEALWSIVGGPTASRIRHPVHALLVAEHGNPVDANAVAVWVEGHKVGHLSRSDAAAMRPGLLALQQRFGTVTALAGVVCGGGLDRPDGLGMLGVFLTYSSSEFGLRPLTPRFVPGELRTGLSEALATDEADDSYDLGWCRDLSEHPAKRISQLRAVLSKETEPISRHFAMAELEDTLYACRDAFPAALEEYDVICEQHDNEMAKIRPALHAKFGTIPLLGTYRQQAIRCQRAKDYTKALWWAERGLAHYGDDAARQEWALDLHKRVAIQRTRLDPPAKRKALTREQRQSVTETLICQTCSSSFERVRSRGRKPLECPPCRADE